MAAADAVELTIDSAWYLADRIGAGTFPWVLAITPPYQDARERNAFAAHQLAELCELGIVAEGRVKPAVRQWISTVCRPRRWLELRYLSSGGSDWDMLRGLVAHRDGQTVVALRYATLLTLSAVTVASECDLTPILTAGLPTCAPAPFEAFTLPAAAGARADKRLREGAALAEVLDQLGIPETARPVVRAAFEGPRRYVEVVAGQHTTATPTTTDVGIAVVDTADGRVLVNPTRAFDGQWVSVFSPGSDAAIGRAVENLTAGLPDGRWFAAIEATRDHTAQRT